MKTNLMRGLAAITLAAAFAVPGTLSAQSDQDNPKHHHYKLIDVGTFGGPNTYLSYPLPGEVQINRHGLVVGVADTPNSDPYNPNCLVDCYLVHAFQWQDGVLSDLGTLPGANNSYAFSSNDHGQIVGVSENGAIDPLTGFPEVEGVLWSNGGIIDLGTLGGNGSFAGTVNKQGQVVGAALNSVPDSFGGSLAIGPFFPVATQLHAFVWENGVMRDLGTLGGPDSEAQYVNESGQIAGQSFIDSTPNPPITAPACSTSGIPTEHPFLWQDGFIDLGSLGGTCGYANWLNNNGQVVGTMTLAGDATNHAFLWKRGKLIDLGTLGGNNSEAWFANDAGDVVGRADFSPASVLHHAFLWSHGVMKDLGTPDGRPKSTAMAINSTEQVVGDSNNFGWLWENGSIVGLDALVVSAAGVHVAGAAAINDRGEIVADGMLANGDDHVVVLVPCDESHPGVEGCDYSLVDASVVPQVPAASHASNRITNPRQRGQSASIPFLRTRGNPAGEPAPRKLRGEKP
jgi:probable HAF family extracellular repeat protein